MAMLQPKAHVFGWMCLLFFVVFSKAPACKMGQIARAMRNETQPPHVSEAARVSLDNGERDVHRLCRRHGLVLPVPISVLHVPKNIECPDDEPLDIPFLKIVDYFKVLVKKHPCLLFGGLEGQAAEARCSEFWARYQLEQPDHVLYQRVSQESWAHVIPICVHGDKGRTLKKSPILNISFESVFGLPAELCGQARRPVKRQVGDGKLHWCCEERQACRRPETSCYLGEALDGCTVKRRKLNDGNPLPAPEDQLHNAKGNSLLSRFLLFAVTSAVYSQNQQTIQSMLTEISKGLVELMAGVTVRGKVYRAALIGVKGDAEFHVESGRFTRSYLNMGTVNNIRMCPDCHAGEDGLSFSDFSDNPCWAPTTGQTVPWNLDDPSSLAGVPFSESSPGLMHRHDMFHVIKYGLARDLAASVILQLAYKKYWDDPGAQDSLSVDARLNRTYARYKLWCVAEQKWTSIKHFQRGNFNYKKRAKFPWVNCKGSDCTLICMFLDFFLGLAMRDPLQPQDFGMLSITRQAVRGALDFVGILHAHHLWLPRGCCALAYTSGMTLLRGYLWLGQLAMDEDLCLFALRSKTHSLHHTLHKMKCMLDNPRVAYILSPAAYLCENNEDWVGKISRLSRRVSGRTTSLRTIQRYLIKMQILTRRLAL